MIVPSAPQRSLAAAFEQDFPMDAAAAKTAVSAVALINAAFEQGSLESQSALAGKLGITEGRVSQVLNGDGNMRVSTLARFLKASGYDLLLQTRPADHTVGPLSKRKRRGAGPRDTRRASTMVADACIGSHDFLDFAWRNKAPRANDAGRSRTVKYHDPSAPDDESRASRGNVYSA